MEYLFYIHVKCIHNKVVQMVQKASTLHCFNLCNVNQNILPIKYTKPRTSASHKKRFKKPSFKVAEVRLNTAWFYTNSWLTRGS